MKRLFQCHAAFIVIGALCLGGVFALPVHAETPDFSVNKTFLSKQPEDTVLYLESSAFGPKRTHLAYVVANEKGMRVMVNQKVGSLYDHIAKGHPIFSPKQSRVGYIADKDGKNFVVVDGTEYPGYDGACCLTFGPQGDNFSYVAQKGDKQFVVLNGKALEKHDMIDRKRGVMFSPDGKHTAYVARNKTADTVSVIHDGKQGPSFDKITEIHFSPDSQKLAYIAVNGSEYFILENSKVVLREIDKAEALTWQPDSATFACMGIKTGDFIVIKDKKVINAGGYNVKTIFDKKKGYTPMLPKTTPPVFSPDGERFAYTKMTGQQYQVIVGGTAGPAFDLVSTVVFSPDSNRYAYIGINKNPYVDKQAVILDGKTGPAFQKVDLPVFSPDSKHFAYKAFTDDKWMMILDDTTPQSPYDIVGEPVFSDNSEAFAYRAMTGKKWRIVHDGKAHASHDAVSTPYFSPGGKRLAYHAADNNKIKMILDNQVNGPYLDVTRPYFSPDDKHAAYLAKLLPEKGQPTKAACIVDGQQVCIFTTYMPGIKDQIIFDNTNRFHFIASHLNQKEELFETFLFEITIKQ